MARPKKELSTEQKIENILKQISETNDKIDLTEYQLTTLKEQKHELENNLKTEKLNLLLEAMDAKNISLDKAKEIIDNMEN